MLDKNNNLVASSIGLSVVVPVFNELENVEPLILEIQRSIATSRVLTEAGFKNCYNVLEGFEGDKDIKEHRGYSGGWKFNGLPWKQQ